MQSQFSRSDASLATHSPFETVIASDSQGFSGPGGHSIPLGQAEFRGSKASTQTIPTTQPAQSYLGNLIKYAMDLAEEGESPLHSLIRQTWEGVSFTVPRLALTFAAKITGRDDLASLAEHEIIFRPTKPSSPSELKNAGLRQIIEEVSFPSRSGQQLYGWYVAPHAGMPTVVFSPGCNERLTHIEEPCMFFTEQGYGFMSFDYEGYGKSTGQVSEQGFYESLDAALDYLNKSRVTPSSDIVLVGNSQGTAVAVDAASRNTEFMGVVLLAPLKSIPDAFRDRLRNMNVPGFLFDISNKFQQRFDSAEKIESITAPLIVMHGTGDTVVPVEHGQTLFELANRAREKLFFALEGTGHSLVFKNGHAALKEAMARLFFQPQRSVG